jgi:hypothetical protein
MATGTAGPGAGRDRARGSGDGDGPARRRLRGQAIVQATPVVSHRPPSPEDSREGLVEISHLKGLGEKEVNSAARRICDVD